MGPHPGPPGHTPPGQDPRPPASAPDSPLLPLHAIWGNEGSEPLPPRRCWARTSVATREECQASLGDKVGGDEGWDGCLSPGKPLQPLPPPSVPMAQRGNCALSRHKISRKLKGSRCGAHMMSTEIDRRRGFLKFVSWDAGLARCLVKYWFCGQTHLRSTDFIPCALLQFHYADN